VLDALVKGASMKDSTVFGTMSVASGPEKTLPKAPASKSMCSEPDVNVSGTGTACAGSVDSNITIVTRASRMRIMMGFLLLAAFA
jgi:hypothetical protein